MPNLSFNILTFKHPAEEYTFYFTNKEGEGLFGIYNTLVPDEVIEQFGEQERYYTSYDNPVEGLFSITKKSRPVYIEKINDEEEIITVKEKNKDFHVSLLKRYYNYKIHNYFTEKDILVKPNFIKDTEIWLNSDKPADNLYVYYDKYTLKVQIARITKQPEILITYEGKSKALKQCINDFNGEIAPEDFTWILYNGQLLRFEDLSEQGRRELEKVYPVWNFEIRKALKQSTKKPDKENKYIKFKSKIQSFYDAYLCEADFKDINPID